MMSHRRSHRLAARDAAIEAIKYMAGASGLTEAEKMAALSYASAKLAEATAHLTAAIHERHLADLKEDKALRTEQEIKDAMSDIEASLEALLHDAASVLEDEEDGEGEDEEDGEGEDEPED